MTTIHRRPLQPRAISLQIPSVLSPLKRTGSGAYKRARSPDPSVETNSKRVKGPVSPGTLLARDEERKERERRKLERDAQKEEFRVKYTRAFPSWVFYFDLDTLDPDSASAREYLEARVCQLGGVCRTLFSALQNLIERLSCSVWKTSSQMKLRILLRILQYRAMMV